MTCHEMPCRLLRRAKRYVTSRLDHPVALKFKVQQAKERTEKKKKKLTVHTPYIGRFEPMLVHTYLPLHFSVDSTPPSHPALCWRPLEYRHCFGIYPHHDRHPPLLHPPPYHPAGRPYPDRPRRGCGDDESRPHLQPRDRCPLRNDELRGGVDGDWRPRTDRAVRRRILLCVPRGRQSAGRGRYR